VALVDSVETTSRRQVLASAVALATSSLFIDPSRVNAADNNGLVSYQDADHKFSILVPSDWEQSVQELPDRRKILLYIKPNSDSKTLLFFAYTPVRSDFTSLSSFGSVDEVSHPSFYEGIQRRTVVNNGLP
jgi:hypothetical protein